METTNKKLIRLLRSVATVYLLTNENRFKIVAYERAADTIDHWNREITDIRENNQLHTLTGIGPSILSHIEDYFKNGKNSYLAKIIATVPQSVFTLMDVPGIGPKKAYKLTNALHLNDPQTAIEKLQHACEAGKIAILDTFGEKSQQEILNAITIYRKRVKKEPRTSLSYAYRIAYDMLAYLRKNPLIKKSEALGSLRRATATIGDIDIVAMCDPDDARKVIEYFTSYPSLSVREEGDKKASLVVSSGNQIDLRVASPSEYGSMLQYFTGSKSHNIKLREHALKLGYSLSEYGIKQMRNNKKKQKMFQFSNEKDLYAFLRLDYIPPELREGTNEIELAEKKLLPTLVSLDDIKGDFHVHSSYDLEPSHDAGENSYLKLLEKTHEKKYEYIAFSDHNPRISGHTDADIIAILKKRKEHIVQKIMSKKNKVVHYFISLEVDILPDGTIALPDQAIDYVDMLIIAIHSRFHMPRDDMTRRILKALIYPKVKILAHPTTRLLERREEIDVDWDSIFDECKKRNIAMEINASPQRLDLPDQLVRRAVEGQVKLAINTDAHAVDQMDGMKYGVSVARRGWAKKSDIINTMQYNEVKKWIEGK